MGLHAVRAAEYVDILVHVELLELVAGRSEVLAGIEFVRLLEEDLANRGGHREPSVRVDVDLAHGALCGLAKLFFGDTDRVGELSAELLDFLDVLNGYRRGAVKNDGEAGEFLLDFGKDIEGEGEGSKRRQHFWCTARA